MKYSTQLYASALVSLWEISPEKDKRNLTNRFLRVLKKNGDIKNVKKIFETIQKELTRRAGGKLVTLEFARHPSDTILKDVVKFLSKKDFVKTEINPSLGAGIRITINEEQELDYSLENKLRRMFTYV